jgi:uncharacterized membrane protein
MFRAYAYVAASGMVWMTECGLFSYFLGLSPWQVVLLAIIYIALFALAVRVFLHSLARHRESHEIATWRAVSLAPMVVMVLGSFVSLPLVVLVDLLGKI